MKLTQTIPGKTQKRLSSLKMLVSSIGKRAFDWLIALSRTAFTLSALLAFCPFDQA